MALLKNNNKLFILLICLTIIFQKCNSATFFTQISVHRDHPGKCWDELSQTAYKPGQSYQPVNACQQITCTKNFMFSGVTCPPTPQINDENFSCTIIDGDNTKPYPSCCPALQCKDNNGKVITF